LAASLDSIPIGREVVSFAVRSFAIDAPATV
jgi:hypothetical protein